MEFLPKQREIFFHHTYDDESYDRTSVGKVGGAARRVRFLASFPGLFHVSTEFLSPRDSRLGRTCSDRSVHFSLRLFHRPALVAQV